MLTTADNDVDVDDDVDTKSVYTNVLIKSAIGIVYA